MYPHLVTFQPGRLAVVQLHGARRLRRGHPRTVPINPHITVVLRSHLMWFFNCETLPTGEDVQD